MNQPMESKVRKSIVAMQGRQVVMMLMQLGVGIYLARELGPEIFGIYGIATFCLSLITLVADFGLGGSLIQRKAEFGQHEISVAFTLQVGISIIAAAIVWVLAPLSLMAYRQAPPELVWIIRSLTLQMVLSAVATTAKLQLEREIQFHKVATIDIVSMIGGNITLLSMVHLGYGVWSFVGG
ncbi:MAG TPA: oligosaccharide flippase family protein, partial [Fibrobacteria bacterium]|nr:oligosaccharide flippase family protein [Fibrobacteria bacterium]